MSIATALIKLQTQRNNLAANLTAKGITAENTEALSSLVPKVLDIKTGGSMGVMACLTITKATGILSPFIFSQSNISTSSI